MANRLKDSCCLLPMILALLVALVAVTVIGVAIISKGFQHQRTITVFATGTASASPSVAKIYVIINATGKTADLANANLSSVVNRLNDTLLPFINGNLSLIQTLSYEIYQPTNCTYVNSYPYYCVPTKLAYYAAKESIAATIPNISNISAVITGVSQISDLQLQDVQAQLSESQLVTLNQEALSQALNNATTQAELLAGGGVQIRVENITVQYSQVYYPSSFSAELSRTNGSVFYGGRMAVQKSILTIFSMH